MNEPFTRLPASPATAAATAAAPTTAATTTAASATAVAATIASTATAALGLGASFINIKGAPAHLAPVQCGDRFFTIFGAGHLHESESPRASGIAVGHDANPIHLPVRFEHLP